MSLWVVVGGQFGSEGKGKVSAFITLKENIDICVRCGGPNSGHSLVGDDGQMTILRQLPTGYINPRTRLLIPAGALIEPDVLEKELELLKDPSRVGVDRNAMIIEGRDRETEARLKLQERLSSTLCGVGSAVARRALRGAEVKLAGHAAESNPWLGRLITNVADETNSALEAGAKVLIEGTQGFGLSLYHSQHYPHCTSRDTSAAGFLSEVGVSPLRVSDIVLVFRTFPIRVAGEQAGPLNGEITWEELGQASGYPYSIAEYTSVTRRKRRVARFDWELAKRAVLVNLPTRIAVNGLDYLNYRNRGATEWHACTQEAEAFVNQLEEAVGVRVTYCGTGPSTKEIFEVSSGAAAGRAAFELQAQCR